MTKFFNFMLLLLLSGLAGITHAEQTCQAQSEVPATTPTARFSDHADGTLTDKQTGLMWAKCAEGLSGSGCTTGLATSHDWDEALDLAAQSMLANFQDWRLPNINELLSIVEQQCVRPAINLSVFPNIPVDQWGLSDFWSATPYAGDTDASWYVRFTSGNSYDWGRIDSDNVRRVRIVRDGQ